MIGRLGGHAGNGVDLGGVDLRERLDLHVAVPGRPLVGLLEEHGADQAREGGFIWE
jgi:hypothetical protein